MRDRLRFFGELKMKIENENVQDSTTKAELALSYIGLALEIQCGVENLKEFSESLPAPDDDGSVPVNADQLLILKTIRFHIGEAMKAADGLDSYF